MSASLPYIFLGGYAALLPTEGKKDALRTDAEPQTLASRGSVIPYLIGRRRVGAIFGWVGARFTRTAGTSGGGKGGGSKKGGAGQVTYAERGWHLLAMGPVKKLHRIWVGGKIVFGRATDGSATINSTDDASGSTHTLEDGSGEFKIYWGEIDQAVDSQLAADTTIASRWPGVCYVYWRSKELGTAPRWPLIEYEIESEPVDSPLEDSDSTISADVTGPVETIEGPNAVHAITQILFGPWPRGLGHDPAAGDFDLDRLESSACIMKWENIPASIFAQDGKQASDVLGEIFADMGFMLSWNPEVGKFAILPIREETDYPEIASDLQVDIPELVTEIGARAADKVIYQFADKNQQYKSVTIVVGDDGQSSFLEYQQARRVDVASVVHFASAAKIAERRSQEALSGGARITINGKNTAKLIYPGCAFTIAGVDGLFRALEVALIPGSSAVRIEAVQDFYGTPVVNSKPIESSAGAPPSYVVAEDPQFDLFEVPAYLLTTQEQVVIAPRIRDNTNIQYADIHLSEDDTTYENEGREFDRQTGGTLIAAWSANTFYEIAQGPTIALLGPDAAEALDLSSDEAGWRSGKQVVLIDDEILFVQKLTAISGSTYRLDGVIRARYDTEKAAHSMGAKVYVCQLGKTLELRTGLLAPGKTIYAKTQPSTSSGSISLADVASVSRALVGKGVVPMAVGALRTEDQRSTYRSGEDVDLFWSWRSTTTPRTGAGMQGAGRAVGKSPPVGLFEIKVYDLGMTLKNTYLSTVPDFTYTNSSIVADLGSETSFVVEVRNIDDGWKSDAKSLTVELV